MSQPYHHGDLKRAIEEAALHVLEERGLEAVSLRAIARALGVSQGAPYHHFPSKQHLLASLATTAFLELHQAMIDAVAEAGADPYDRLAGLCRAAIWYCVHNPGRFRLMFGQHMEELEQDHEVYAAGRPTRVMLEDLVAECVGRESPDAPEIELAVWAMVHGVVWLVVNNEIPRDKRFRSLETTVEHSIQLLIRGIRTR